MNEQIIAINVIIKHIFSMLSILCEKLPLVRKMKNTKITPIITIGAMRIEWNTVANNPTIITPIATNEVKYTITSSLFMLPLL